MSLKLSKLAAVLAVLALITPSLFADTVTVTSTADSGAGSLRQALVDVSPGGTIDFSVTGTILLASSMRISKGVTIQGPGAQELTISGQGAVNIFEVAASGLVSITGLTLTSGVNSFAGGAVYYSGSGGLSIEDMVFTSNNAGFGGAVYYSGPSGPLTVTDSTFTGNSAPEGGGGAIFTTFNPVTITGCTFQNNSGSSGGAIYINGQTTVSQSTFTTNSATQYGGGAIYISSGDTSCDLCTFTGNHSQGPGGAFYSSSDDLEINDSTFSNNAARENGGVLYISMGNVNLTNSFLGNNSAVSNSGAIYNSSGQLTVANCTLWSNYAGSGGAIVNASVATVVNSTLSGNFANNGIGGGILNTKRITVENSLVSNNNPSDCSDAFDEGQWTVDDNLSTDKCATGLGSAALGIDYASLPADNGGPTLTFALLAGSQAIDAGDNSVCAAAPVSSVDQRGAPRPYGPSCDIGAFEFGATP